MRSLLLSKKIGVLLILLATLILVVENVNGATITSTASGGAWATGSTWVGGVAPVVADLVVIDVGATVTTGGDRTCAGITINGILSMGNNDDLNVNGDVSGTGIWIASSSSRKISLTGNWSFSPTAVSSGTVTFTGTNVQTFNGSISSTGSGVLVINKSGNSVTLGNDLSIGTFTLTNGTFDPGSFMLTISTTTMNINGGTIIVNSSTTAGNYSRIDSTPAIGSTIVYTNSSPIINGSITYQNLTFSGAGSTANPSTNLIIQGNLSNTGGGTLDFSARSVTLSGTVAANSIDGFTTNGTVSVTKTAGTATFNGNVNGGALSKSGSGTLDLGSGFIHTFTGNWTRTAGTINGNSSTLKIGGSVSGSGGTFEAGTGTVVWFRTGTQTLAAVSYNNLVLSGTLAKTIPSGTSVSGNLNIRPGATGTASASIAADQNIAVGSLTLGDIDRVCGTWGSTSSIADNKNNTYFVTTTGYLTVGDKPSAPSVGAITQPTCSVETGSVVLSGLPSGNWTIIPGNISGSGSSTTISTLAAGTYNFTVTNDGGCVSAPSSNVVINTQPLTPPAPTVGTVTQPTCAVATGSVLLNGLPASGTWTLTRNPGGITTNGTGTSTTISGLLPETYTYTVTNEDNGTSCPGSGTGLNAEYFNNRYLTSPAILTRTDATVNYDWGTGSPDGTINSDLFSARWTGQVQPCFTETYIFTTSSDDGIRLWVNGSQIINNWTDHAPIDNTGSISLSAGQKYDIILEYYENGGGAVARLFWSSPSQPIQIIPQSQLYSEATGCTSLPSTNVVIDSQPATPLAPTGSTSQSFCSDSSPTVANLVATGTTIQWYLAPSGGYPLVTTTALINSNHYYASQTVNGCESASRLDVTATLNSVPSAPTANNQPKTYTGTTNSTAISATPGAGEAIDWYDQLTGGSLLFAGSTSYIPDAINVGNYTYYAETRNTTTGCISNSRTAVTLTITSKTIAVTADAKSKTYGDADPALTYTFSPALQSGDSFSGSLTRGAGESVGNYAIIQGTLSLSSNYTLTYTAANLTINQRSLTITANNQSKTYGSTLAFAGTEFTSSGLQNGETIGSVILSSAGSPATAVVNTYPIAPSAAAGGTFLAGNYAIIYSDGTLTVGEKILTVTAENKSVTYGDATPVLTYTMTGFANGETESTSVSGLPILSTGYTSMTQVSSSPVLISVTTGTLVSANYSFSFFDGSVNINLKGLTIIADNRSKCFGDSDSFTGTEFTSSGLINGDTANSVTLTSTGTAQGANPGTYTIISSAAAGSGLTNYNITYTNGTYTVNALPTPEITTD